PRVSELVIAPGNAGTAEVGRNVGVGAGDIEGLARLAQKERVDFTVVGPEAPLADGIVDVFEEQGLAIFGPTKGAALIESSKSFAKELMMQAGVPTGFAKAFTSYAGARAYIEEILPPIVVKADGLAAGKGVVVAQTREEALEALRQQMEEKTLGHAGDRVLIEEYLEGQEVSAFAFVDGERISPLAAACDYKRIGEGDTGPNTGGMGSYSPPDVWTAALEAEVRARIMEPVVKALADMGTPYRGALYAGLMLAKDGPKVVEFNCRLGDPETQALLPRLKSDLLEVMMKTARGALGGVSIEWDARACVGVAMASGGYPGSYKTGFSIGGLDDVDEDVVVFHAGTALKAGNVVTDGGRVLTVAAMGRTIAEAHLDKASLRGAVMTAAQAHYLLFEKYGIVVAEGG
ncbi:MAG: phosphoribosylamine--glycine ligase, partial [Ardenticatenaceae bacterium]